MIFESDKGGNGVLRVEGPLGIQRAGEFRDALAGAVEAAEHLELDLTEVEDIDVACLQLICSALTTCGAANRTMTVRAQASGACERAIEAAGLLPRMVGVLQTV